MTEKTTKLNASQRISALEDAIVKIEEKYGNQIMEMAKIMDELDRKIIAINRRLNANIEATDSGDKVNDIIQEENNKQLKFQVDSLLESGVFSSIEESTDTNTFIVCRYLNKEGKTTMPRAQFYVKSLKEEEQEQFIGLKAGDMLEKDDFDIEILELYKGVFDESEESTEKQEHTEETLSES